VNHPAASRPSVSPVLLTVLCGVLVAVLCTGCAVNGLAFKANDSVKILSPVDQSTAHLPLHVRWASSIPAKENVEYAVFLDSSPMAPGQNFLDWIPSDDPCHQERGCPNTQWLNQHFIYVTTRKHVTIPLLPPPSNQTDAAEVRNSYHVTIVLLNKKTGRRLGESAWSSTVVVSQPTL
jgi:hypothetical protein